MFGRLRCRPEFILLGASKCSQPVLLPDTPRGNTSAP